MSKSTSGVGDSIAPLIHAGLRRIGRQVVRVLLTKPGLVGTGSGADSTPLLPAADSVGVGLSVPLRLNGKIHIVFMTPLVAVRG